MQVLSASVQQFPLLLLCTTPNDAGFCRFISYTIHAAGNSPKSKRASEYNGQKVSDALLSSKRILFIILLQANNALALVVQFVFTAFNFPNELDFVRLRF